MKIKLTSTLVAIGWLGLSCNTQALAQYGSRYAPARVATSHASEPTAQPRAIPTANSAEEIAAPGGVLADPSALTADPTPMETYAPPSEMQSMVDNGLWNGEPMGPCCSICGGGSAAPADWYIEEEIRIFTRGRPRDIGIGFEFGDQSTQLIGTEKLNTRSAMPDISAIWGMKIGHYFARDTLNRDHFVEFSFWGLNNWRDEATSNGNGNLITVSAGNGQSDTFGTLYSGFSAMLVQEQALNFVWVLNGNYLPGFDQADSQRTLYKSSTNNFELNGRIVPRNREDLLVMQPNGRWRRECQPGQYISYLYGLRFFQLNETFNFHSQGVTTRTEDATGAIIDVFNRTGDYDIVAHNNLLGLQGGADWTYRHC